MCKIMRKPIKSLFSLIVNHSHLLLIINVLKLGTLRRCLIRKETLQAALGSTIVLAVIQASGLMNRDRPSRGQNGEGAKRVQP